MAARFILAGLFLLASLASSLATESVTVDAYAAVVNDRVITVSDVRALIQPVERQLEATFEGDRLEQKKQDAYDEGRRALIERALILEEFKAQKGQLPDRLVDERLDELIRERFGGDRAAFLQALSDERMTIEEYRGQIREQLIIGLLRRQEVMDRIKVSPTDVQRRYQENLDRYRVPPKVRLRMIALNKGASPEDREVKRSQALHIRERLLGGEDFAAVARAESEGSKAASGGDWGWVDPTILRPELAEVLESIPVGEVSDVVETEEEFYLLKIEGRQNESVVPFEDVQEDLTRELRNSAGEQLYADWISRLENKHFIKLFTN